LRSSPPVVPPGALPPRLSTMPLTPRGMLGRPDTPVELLPPWLPLPLMAALPFAKARPRGKLAAPPLSSLGPPLLVPQPPRHAQPRMVVRSRSPPRGPRVPWMRPIRTPSRSPLADRRHS
jgi:hypothetical protein